MDISLLPDIHITTSPTFPRCQENLDSQVIVNCETKSPSETFNVTWTSQGISAKLVPIPPSMFLVCFYLLHSPFFFLLPFNLIGKINKIVIFFFSGFIEEIKVYGAITAVRCAEGTLASQVTCTFRNKCNQEVSATKDIIIINSMIMF